MDTPPPDDSRHAIIWLAGPRLLGLFFNWGLLGILTAQAYIYLINFPQDRRVFKVLIFTVYLVDWIQTCSATYDGFQWFVYGWGDINVLNNSETGYLNVPILSSIVAITVQTFFGWRIWTLSRSSVSLICIAVLAVAQAGAAIAAAYFLATVPLENAREPGLPVAVGIRLGTSVVADAIIAVSMTYFLLKGRDETIKFNNVLTRLIRLTIETGTVTALFAVMDLVFFLAAHNGLHEVSGVVLAKLYSNSLLVIFNNRVFMTTRSFQAHGRDPMHIELESRSVPSTSSRMVFRSNLRVQDSAASVKFVKSSAGTGDVKNELQIPIHAYVPESLPPDGVLYSGVKT